MACWRAVRAASVRCPARRGTRSRLRASFARLFPLSWSNNDNRRIAVPHDEFVELLLSVDLHFNCAESNLHCLPSGVIWSWAIQHLPLGKKGIQAPQLRKEGA